MNSTGGQIMPPVMGAGAFLMAEILSIPYSRVATAAIIPALFYFLSAYWMIDFYSAAAGLKGISREDLPVFRKIMLEKGYLLIPIIVLLVSLIQTGLGTKFAMTIFNYSAGNLCIAMVFTKFIAIMLGMGMPTTAAYAICASVLAPALIQMQVQPIAAHLFIFYFA